MRVATPLLQAGFPQAFTHVGLINAALYLQGNREQGDGIAEVH